MTDVLFVDGAGVAYEKLPVLDADVLSRLGQALTAVVSGTVALDASTLAALEQITATISGTVPVTGTVAVSNLPATQPVSAASLPLPAGASTEATLALIKAKTDNIDVLLSSRTKPADTQPVSGPATDAQLRATPLPVSSASLPLPTGATQEVTLGRRFGGAKLAYSAVLTATTDLTPTVGKAIRLLWVAFIPNSDNTTSNLVTVGYVGGGALYTGYAMAHWERFDGAVNTALRITVANAQPVAVTVHYEEF